MGLREDFQSLHGQNTANPSMHVSLTFSMFIPEHSCLQPTTTSPQQPKQTTTTIPRVSSLTMLYG